MRTVLLLRRNRIPGIVLCLALMVLTGTAIAQDGSGEGEQRPLRQTGTIESLQQDAGFIVVSGQRYRVSNGSTRVYLGQREMRLHDLDNGMVIAYATNGAGVLLRVDLLGPADLIRALEQS